YGSAPHVGVKLKHFVEIADVCGTEDRTILADAISGRRGDEVFNGHKVSRYYYRISSLGVRRFACNSAVLYCAAHRNEQCAEEADVCFLLRQTNRPRPQAGNWWMRIGASGFMGLQKLSFHEDCKHQLRNKVSLGRRFLLTRLRQEFHVRQIWSLRVWR